MKNTTSAPVVVGVDGSAESLAAVSLAAAEAALRDAPLRVVHARVSGATADAETLGSHDVSATMAAALRTALDARPGLEITTEIVDASASTVLLDESDTSAVLVIGARGSGGVSQLLLGSVALDVVTRAHRPVMMARGTEPATDAPVVVGVSGAPTGRDAIGYAFAEAEARGVPLHAVHAFHYPYSRDASPIAEREHERANRLLANWVGEWSDKYPTVAVHLFSVHALDPVAALLDFSSSAGLLVLGSRHRGKLRTRLLGSTGYTLMRTSQCPLAIVHKEPQPGQPQHFASALTERARV